jgi:uncharacterized protein with von Willebrand factor type A (vWA) domain
VNGQASVTGGRSLGDVARSTGIRPSLLRELFREDEQRGIVEQTAGGWRLTPAASRRFGRALRDLAPITEERRT